MIICKLCSYFCSISQVFSFNAVPSSWFYNIFFCNLRTRGYLLRGYIPGVLTHSTAWEQHWNVDETLKQVLIYVAWLSLQLFQDTCLSVLRPLLLPTPAVISQNDNDRSCLVGDKSEKMAFP